MKTVFSLFILLIVSCSVYSQTLASFDKWIDYPVSSSYVKKAISAETYEGNNTWVAIQIDTSASKKYQQLLRLDIDGNLIFAKEHYTKGFIYNIKATSDDGCLLIGITARGSFWVGWVAKCDRFGEIQWSYSYGEPYMYTYFEQAVLAKNGNYVVAGYAYNSGNGGVVAMEIDTLGNMQWVGKYDEISSEEERLLSRLWNLEDGSYILTSYCLYFPFITRLIRLKPNGDVWYYQTYWTGPNFWINLHGITDIIPIKDSQKHFYFTVARYLYPIVLVETDSMGVILSKKELPVHGRPKFLTFMNDKMLLIEQKDMGSDSENITYLVDTTTLETKFLYYNRNYYCTKSSYRPKNANIILTYLNKTASKVLLHKRSEEDFNVKFCKDTLINLTGFNTYFKDTLFPMLTSKPTYTQQSLTHSSKSISVTIHTECSKPTSIEEKPLHNTQNVFIYPNPAQTHVYITLPTQNTDLRVWDIHGKLVYERKNLNTLYKIDIEHFSQGLYNVELQTNHQKQFQKFIKID